jgi:hypothetical protein
MRLCFRAMLFAPGLSSTVALAAPQTPARAALDVVLDRGGRDAKSLVGP